MIKRTSSASMIYGPSGSGKSSLIAEAAEYLWEAHKKVLFLYSSDLGGYGDKVDALVKLGIIWVWKIRTRRIPLETCSRASEGWWPAEFKDPLTGETEEAVSLVPPVITKYQLLCANRHEVLLSTNSTRPFQKTIMCPTCRQKTDLSNGYIEKSSTIVPFFENRGGVAYDSITSMSDWIMIDDLQERRARGELKGEEAAIASIKSGALDYGGSNRSDYNFAQARALSWVANTMTIQGLAIPPLFTALEDRGEDKRTNRMTYGPQLAGSAKTAAVPQWVGDCLGTEHTKSGEFRLHLTDYYKEEDNTPHPCKLRVEPGHFPDYLADRDEKGNALEPFAKFSLKYLFEKIDKIHKDSLDKARKKYKDAPGPPDAKLFEISKVAVQQATAPSGGNTPAAKSRGPVMPPKSKPSPIRGR